MVAGDVAGGAEWIELGAVAWTGDLLVVEAFAPRDVEHPAPGDRLWLAVPTGPVSAAGEAPVPDTARRVVPFGPVDTDATGPVLDMAALRSDVPADLLSARADGRLARVVSADPATALLAPAASLAAPADFAPARAPLHTILGAFGSRQVFAVHDDLAHLEATNDGLPEPSQHSDLGLDAAPTGLPAAGVLAGAPVWIVPMGQDQPALVATGDGARLRPVIPEGDALACDGVALGPSFAGNLDGRLALACRRGDTVLFGQLEHLAP